MGLLWKEFRQQRMTFVFGCGAGILGPFLYAVTPYADARGSMAGSTIVGIFGALYAMVLATSTTQWEVRNEDFWQSRPLSSARLFLTKVVVGAGTLLAAFLIVQSLDSPQFLWEASTILTMTWPISVLLFSISMFFTILMRNAAKAAILSMWAGLLVYLMPLLTPGLQSMNAFEMLINSGRTGSLLVEYILPGLRSIGFPMGRATPMPLRKMPGGMSTSQILGWILRSPGYPEYLAFLGLMATGVALFTALTMIASRRRWHWQPGQKAIVWTIGASTAFMFGLAMLQAGHELLPAVTYEGKRINPDVKLFGPIRPTIDWVSKGRKGAGGYSFSLPTLSSSRICIRGEDLYMVDLVRDASVRDGSSPWSLGANGILSVIRAPSKTGSSETLSQTRFARIASAPQPDMRNMPCPVLFLRGESLFIGYQDYLTSPAGEDYPGNTEPFLLRMLVVDVSDPVHPRRISDEPVMGYRTLIRQSKGASQYENYAYLYGEMGLVVLSIENPGKPQLRRVINPGQLGVDPGTPVEISQAEVSGNMLVCVGPRAVLLLDLTEPASPRPVFTKFWRHPESERLGAAWYEKGSLFLSTDSGIEIHRISISTSGQSAHVEIGRRSATPIEKIAGRQSCDLMLFGTMLFEAAGRFGLLVYDISDPSHPRRAFHFESGIDVTAVGTWLGMPYVRMGSVLRLIGIP
jgi:hypothetical protein